LRLYGGRPYNITTGYDNFNDGVTNARPDGIARNSAVGPGLFDNSINISKTIPLLKSKSSVPGEGLPGGLPAGARGDGGFGGGPRGGGRGGPVAGSFGGGGGRGGAGRGANPAGTTTATSLLLLPSASNWIISRSRGVRFLPGAASSEAVRPLRNSERTNSVTPEVRNGLCWSNASMAATRF